MRNREKESSKIILNIKLRKKKKKKERRRRRDDDMISKMITL